MKILLLGSSGKMGQAIQSLAPNQGIEIAAQVGSGESIDPISAQGVDCIVDFSVASKFEEHLSWAQKNHLPLVSGVTPQPHLSSDNVKIPVLWDSNMSLGIQILKKTLESFKNLEDQFQFEILDVHHKEKKDAPSGTAKSLETYMAQSLKLKVEPPKSFRGGSVFGEHQVWALGESENLVFQHQALSRDTFAQGALMAVHWLVKQKPGVYSMGDILKP